MRAALAVLLALAPVRAWAGDLALPPDMPGVAMPSRDPGAADLRGRARRVAGELAALLDRHETGAPPPAGDTTLAAAFELQAAGKLDEAAASFDLALARGARRPGDVADPAAFISAHVARTAIALARGEAELADSLLARAMRYDPTLSLTPAEDSPTLRAAFDRVRTRSGATPELEIADLGESCGSSIVVARIVASGIEYRRYDDCKLVATAIAPETGTPADIARVLAGNDVVVRRPTSPPVTPRHAAATGRPFYRRAWFWVAVGGVAAASAGTIYWLGRDGGGDQLDVMTRF